jgi:elongator complex protein 2
VKLASSSFDCSILIWEEDESENVWINSGRLGQLYGNKNHFYGIQTHYCEEQKFCFLLGYTYTGALYLYSNYEDEEQCSEFKLETTTGGHNKSVTSLEWSSTGFLVSGSLDQTTRVFGCRKLNEVTDWVELSRAQIHGYDINALTLLKMPLLEDDEKVSDLLVCAGDEKILRILEPNNFFVNFHNNICGKNLRLFFSEEERKREDEIISKKDPLTYLINAETGQEALGLMIKSVKTERKNYYYDESKDKKPEGKSLMKRPS